jgi:hypothetical protein
MDLLAFHGRFRTDNVSDFERVRLVGANEKKTFTNTTPLRNLIYVQIDFKD